MSILKEFNKEIQELKDLGAMEKTLRSMDRKITDFESDLRKFYLNYQELKSIYDQSKDWKVVFAKTDGKVHNIESFVSLVEDITGMKISEPQDINKATGTDIEFSKAFRAAQIERYNTKLKSVLYSKGKYKDLTAVDPKIYGLELSDYEKTKSIGDIIYFAYNFLAPGGLIVYPGLRKIAKALDAPYSVIIDAFKGITSEAFAQRAGYIK